jgi:sigma-B regulation protein RsbU (phosphoserine phosphatase)
LDRNRRLLVAVFAFAAFYQAGYSYAILDLMRFGTVDAREPFEFGYRLNVISGVYPEAAAAGIHFLDVLEQVDGQPFTGTRVLERVADARRAGDILAVVVRRPDGSRLATRIRLAAIRSTPPPLDSWFIVIAVDILLPVFCLALGFWVAAARPYDPVAWVLLGLMIGFSQMATGFAWNWPFFPAALVWNAAVGQSGGAWLVWLVVFALRFPERAPFDIRRPWLKWILIALLVVQTLVLFLLRVGSAYSFASIAFLKPFLNLLIRFPLPTYVAFVAIGVFFSLIGSKIASATTADARRRVRILYYGTVVSLSPMFVAAVFSLFHGGEFFSGLPKWLVILALVFLLLFPLTLAHVIVVQRAMQVSMVLRQGVKYTFARGGLRAMRILLIAVMITVMTAAFSQHDAAIGFRMGAIALLVMVVFFRKRFFDGASLWIDKRVLPGSVQRRADPCRTRPGGAPIHRSRTPVGYHRASRFPNPTRAAHRHLRPRPRQFLRHPDHWPAARWRLLFPRAVALSRPAQRGPQTGAGLLRRSPQLGARRRG